MKKTHRQINLKDGRKLGYAEYGTSDGTPLFFFHGFPSSRFHASTTHAVAKKLKIRVISIDRPGYGLSDFQINRKLLDWPGDVVELADTLHLKNFAVIGVSGGAPYAAVCAYKIPKRITKVGIVVGLCPLDVKGVLRGMSFFNRFSWSLYQTFPSLGSLTASLYLSRLRKVIDIFSFVYQSKSDREIITKEMKESIALNQTEAFKQGKQATAMDLKLYANDWGFEVKNIKAKVYLWYGGADKSISLAMGEYYAKEIKKSTLVVYPKEGHFLLGNHVEEILQTITK